MDKLTEISAVYVDRFPQELEHGKLYISKDCRLAVHLCACGCGEKTFTPLDEQGWSLHEEGGRVTLSPSIGNFCFPCKSHYFIQNSKVVWV